ncbi:MAG: qxtA [Gammaproteobacteria bacterium]|jgi:cytochrome d ubiquinol oxidase subunit I|nr:qxtA [Gammaproteobacteria bacterium]
MSALLLSRIQFGFTIGFHILFPTLNLGLALFLVCMEGAWLKTKNTVYLTITKFWTKVFALTFGMGVVSGIVMSYEIGTNFSGYSNSVGPVLGSLFAYEVLSAFFLEAGFLGIMLFGWNRVGPKTHFAATFLVMLGTAISAFWILSANSWMQTPAGYHFADGKFTVVDWWQVIFNPSDLLRFSHMMLASYITTCFVVAGVSAYYLLQKRHLEMAKKCFSFALLAAVIITPTQVFMGDMLGLKIHEYQPLKTAAMEGVWETQRGAPLVLFAYPDVKTQKNLYSLEIPYGASLFNTHKLDGELVGLKSVPPSDWPVVATTFFSFRIMVGLGFVFLFIAGWALYLRWRKKLYENKWLLRGCVVLAPMGFVATIAGWMVAESGRQPWVVYGLLRTQEAVSTLITAHQVWISFLVFLLVYGVVFSFYLLYLFRFIKTGPQEKVLSTEAAPFTYMEKIEEGKHV